MSSDASTRARCAAVLEQFVRGGEPPWWLTSKLIDLAAEDTDFIDLLPADVRDELREWSRDPAPHPEDVFMVIGGSWQDEAAYDAYDIAQRELAFRAGLNLHRLFHPDVPVPAPHAKVRCGVVAEVLLVDGLVAILDEGLET